MNNYVENLFVGTSADPPNNLHALEQLIPNSQVIINPPWPAKADRGRSVAARSTEWRTELFLHPGDWIPWVAAAVVGTVVTLGMVVVWLGEREKKEDEKEKRRALHAINFHAL
jgi:integrin alpha FG-GAP repeat containing protein 1